MLVSAFGSFTRSPSQIEGGVGWAGVPPSHGARLPLHVSPVSFSGLFGLIRSFSGLIRVSFGHYSVLFGPIRSYSGLIRVLFGLIRSYSGLIRSYSVLFGLIRTAVW